MHSIFAFTSSCFVIWCSLVLCFGACELGVTLYSWDANSELLNWKCPGIKLVCSTGQSRYLLPLTQQINLVTISILFLKRSFHVTESEEETFRYRLRALFCYSAKSLLPALTYVRFTSTSTLSIFSSVWQIKTLKARFWAILSEANFLISQHIQCCFSNHLSRLTILNLKSSLLIYCMPFFFYCNHNTICA